MPRTSSEDLFRLVKSLTPDEKRFFKKHIRGRILTVPAYCRLFDVIDSMNAYDESQILRKVTSIRPAQLSNQKKYLYQSILSSLRKMRESENWDHRINNSIHEAQILFDKRLTIQCSMVLKKARKLAEKYDKKKLLFVISEMEETLHNETAKGEEFDRKLETIFSGQSALLENEKSAQELRFVLHRVSRYFRSSGLLGDKNEMEKLDALMLHPALHPAQPYRNFTERYFYLNTYAMFYMLKENWMESFRYRKELVELFRLNPHFRGEQKKSYVSTLNSYILACEFTRNFTELENAFFSVRELFHDPVNRHNHHLMLRIMGGYSSMLHSCILFGEFEKGFAIFREIEPAFERLKDQVNKASAVSFAYTFAYIHFGVGQYRRALYWLNRILNERALDVREDILIFSNLFNLIIHYELGHGSQLEYYVKSTYRFLLKKRSRFMIERIVIDFIGKTMPRISSAKEEKAAFTILREKVQQLQYDPKERKAFDYFDFLSWLESKVTGRSFAETVVLRSRRPGNKSQ